MHELKTTQAAMLQILATHCTHQLRVDERLARIEPRLSVADPAIP
jgi:hypothetical protein